MDNLQEMTFVCQALHDFDAEEEDDLPFEQGEQLTIIGVRNDGWWEAKNEQGITGSVPSTFLDVPENIVSVIQRTFNADDIKDGPSKSSGSSSRKIELFPTIDETSNTDENEPSMSFEFQEQISVDQNTYPEGFRSSILAQLVNKGSSYSLGNFMLPKLDETGISFTNIVYDKNSCLRPNTALLQKKISLIAARHIPELPIGYTVKSRHVRMCFHDGNNVLSNIHTVKAKCNKNSPRLWMFPPKITSKDSCIEDGEIFLKCDKCVPTLGIFFEICVSYESNAGDSGEMSSGWAFMRLLNDSGMPIKSKTNILKVQETEPFAAFLSYADSPGGVGFFKKKKSKQKLSRVVISVSDPDRVANQQISFFPSTLIGPWSCTAVLAMYRKLTAEALLERDSFDSAELILSPLLATTPRVLNEPDLMDILRVAWAAKVKSVAAEDDETESVKKKIFKELFCETVFVIVNSNFLCPYVFGESTSENARRKEIQRLMNIQDSEEETIFLSGEVEFSPLSLKMISANIIELDKGVCS